MYMHIFCWVVIEWMNSSSDNDTSFAFSRDNLTSDTCLGEGASLPGGEVLKEFG